MSCANFKIDGNVYPVESRLEFSQSYAPINGSSIVRMLDGSAIKQRNWIKISTSLSGSGWVPPGLDNEGMDYCAEHVLSCAAQRSIVSATNVIVIPSERRTDSGYEPVGFAIVKERQVSTPISISVDTVTLDTVPDATGYQVIYWPEITVLFSEPPQVETDISGAAVSWSLEAEQV